MLAGIVTFFLLACWPRSPDRPASARRAADLLFAPPDIAWRSYAALFAVPVIATLISLITARIALMRTLRPGR